jgi:deoxyadenosine/deoxycytidine kinase
MNKIIISIEGNIGVGKSTFLSLLKDKLNSNEDLKDKVAFVYEPVDEWLEIKDADGTNLLDTFYKDTRRWSYTFQNIAYITRMSRLIEALHNPKNEIVILDRSLSCDLNTFTKMLYDSGDISELEWNAYKKWNTFYEKHFGENVKHHVIYLRADPNTAYNRLHLRNRNEEGNVSLKYLDTLGKYHDNWLLYREDTVIVDANKDFLKNLDYFEEIFGRFMKILN